MVQQYVNGLMEQHILVSGKIAEKKDKAHYNFQTELFIKEILRMISQMEWEKKYFLMEVIMKVNF